MTLAMAPAQRAPHPSSLADVLEVVLDKGIVIDAFVRVSLVGIELLTVDARIVVASVDTYLRFAEAVNRLDIQPQQEAVGLPGLVGELQESGAEHKTHGALQGMKESAKEVVGSLRDRDDRQDDESDSDRGGRGERERAHSGRTRRTAATNRRGRSARDEDGG
jgi:hypothetical protein